MYGAMELIPDPASGEDARRKVTPAISSSALHGDYP
jgi:hypothetical protein